jgi:hypothetical protein
VAETTVVDVRTGGPEGGDRRREAVDEGIAEPVADQVAELLTQATPDGAPALPGG